ncbi:MAG: HAD-IIA family hydrolase [bacterium]
MKKVSMNFSLVKAVAIDLDGVVYFGNRVAPGAAAAIEGFRQAGIKVIFITNNSGKNREEIASKLNGLDIPCAIEEIYSSGYAAVLYIKSLKSEKLILVIGSDSLREEFVKAGLPMAKSVTCGFLVVGLDISFTYDKIAAGMEALAHGAEFIACNIDANFPVEKGRLLPACGAMVAAIERASGKKVEVIVGKPNNYILQLVAREYNLKPQELLVIGDSLDSDISMADKSGSPAILISSKTSPHVCTVKSLYQACRIITNQRLKERN